MRGALEAHSIGITNLEQAQDPPFKNAPPILMKYKNCFTYVVPWNTARASKQRLQRPLAKLNQFSDSLKGTRCQEDSCRACWACGSVQWQCPSLLHHSKMVWMISMWSKKPQQDEEVISQVELYLNPQQEECHSNGPWQLIHRQQQCAAFLLKVRICTARLNSHSSLIA